MRTPEAPEQPHDSELSALIRAAGDGDQNAWRRLVDWYARRIFALARSRRMSPEMAEEITQSVFATVATKLAAGDYTERGRFESWLFRVAMNRVRDEARRRTRHAAPMDPADFARESGPAPAEPAPGPDEELSRLRDAMCELSDPDREIIELRHHGQLSFKQIADLLGEPIGTLLARHHRALKKLRDIMERAGAPDPSGDLP